MLRSYARVVVGEGEGVIHDAYDFQIQPMRQELYGVSTRLLPRFLLLVFSYLQHDGLVHGRTREQGWAERITTRNAIGHSFTCHLVGMQ